MGNAARLTDRFGGEGWWARGEWLMGQVAWQGGGGNDVEQRAAHSWRHGVSEEALHGFRLRGNHYRQVVPSVPAPFHAVRGGDVPAVGGRRWQAFTVLAHAREHACLYCSALGVHISGDQVLPKITANVSVWPDQPRGNPLRLYLGSFQRFRPAPAETLVLPSPGLPFRGLHARPAFLRHPHDARLAEARDALAEPATVGQLVPILIRRELDTHQLGLAIGEALAHLHCLGAEAQVERLVGADGVHRCREA
jgi:glyoxylase-like metal-dependent hydrolase (beta-lactamase superfamily II)